ncbi:MAG: ferrous iron transport protein A [Clostridia bacterium]|nr:ferrous iron transport protein A [Clostridia bacterium]
MKKSKRLSKKLNSKQVKNIGLTKGSINVPYVIQAIEAPNEAMRNFLFTLGCYEGEHVTIISKLSLNYVISIKDARYSIDEDLAKAIII